MPSHPRRADPTFLTDVGVRIAALALALSVAGCADSATSPGGNEPRLELLTSGDLRGLAHEPLLDDVQVRLLDGEERPRVGVPVTASVEGGGTAEVTGVTDGQGRTSVVWTLGAAASTQTLRLSAPGAAPLTVEADALRPDETDAVVIRGALGPIRGVLIVRDMPDEVLVRQVRVAADTVFPIQPMEGPAQALVFPSANRPEFTHGVVWTAGVDTLVVELRPPVQVDVEVRVRAGPFAELRPVVDLHLARMEKVWIDEGMGTRLGEVTIRDEAGEEGSGVAVDVQSLAECEALTAGTPPEGVARITYVDRVNGFEGAAYACAPFHAWLGSETGRFPQLLAHEVGHLFSLIHVPEGVMVDFDPGTTFTEGEIFRSHFNERSGLDTVLDAQPEAVRRECTNFVNDRRCLPLDWELPDG